MLSTSVKSCMASLITRVEKASGTWDSSARAMMSCVSKRTYPASKASRVGGLRSSIARHQPGTQSCTCCQSSSKAPRVPGPARPPRCRGRAALTHEDGQPKVDFNAVEDGRAQETAQEGRGQQRPHAQGQVGPQEEPGALLRPAGGLRDCKVAGWPLGWWRRCGGVADACGERRRGEAHRRAMYDSVPKVAAVMTAAVAMMDVFMRAARARRGAVMTPAEKVESP